MPDNPTALLARSVDGWRVRGETLIGRVLDVSYERGPNEAIAVARSLGARWVVGLGVATSRDAVCVESIAVPDAQGLDVDGGCPTRHGDGPVRATLDVELLAQALGGEVSTDAGRYVCNAWLYKVVSALPGRRVGFVHVPPQGLSRERLLQGLDALVATARS